MDQNVYNPKKNKFGKAKTIEQIKNNIKDVIRGVTGITNIDLDKKIYSKIPTIFEDHKTELTFMVIYYFNLFNFFCMKKINIDLKFKLKIQKIKMNLAYNLHLKKMKNNY